MEKPMKPHIHLSPSEDYNRVVVCGSPERAGILSHYLDSPKLISKNREYHSYLGTFKGEKILITSHGVGSAGAAICFQELIDVGAKSIIRIGTAGGLYDETKIGDIVVATSAVRKDGVSSLMISTGFPAVASLDLTLNLRRELTQNAIDHRVGIVVSSDLFYPGPLGDDLELYKRAGALAVEMECSTLFVIGTLRKIQTGALVVLDGQPLKWTDGHYDPNPDRLKKSVEACFHAAAATLVAAPAAN